MIRPRVSCLALQVRTLQPPCKSGPRIPVSFSTQIGPHSPPKAHLQLQTTDHTVLFHNYTVAEEGFGTAEFEAQPLSSCVTAGTLLYLSEPQELPPSAKHYNGDPMGVDTMGLAQCQVSNSPSPLIQQTCN